MDWDLGHLLSKGSDEGPVHIREGHPLWKPNNLWETAALSHCSAQVQYDEETQAQRGKPSGEARHRTPVTRAG